MRSGLKNHRRHQRIQVRINGPKAGRFAAAVLEGLIEDQVQSTANRPGTVAVEVLEDGQWRTTLHPSEAAAEWFMKHSEHETRRIER